MDAAEFPIRLMLHGHTVTIRPADAADLEGLQAYFERLDEEDRRARFFSAHQPTRRVLERWLATPASGGVILVAETDDAVIVAEAGWMPIGDRRGELAISVDPEWRGWLASYLVELLVQSAFARDLRTLEAEVLSTNCAMLAVLRARGAAVRPDLDPATVRLVIGTASSGPVWSDDDPHPRIVVEGPRAGSPAILAAQRAGLAVLVCPGPGGRRVHPCPLLVGEACPLVAGADLVVVAASDPTAADALMSAHRADASGPRAVRLEAPIPPDGLLGLIEGSGEGRDVAPS